MNSSLHFAILKHIHDVGYVTLNGFFSKKYSRNGPVRLLLGLDHISYASVDDAKRSVSATLGRLHKEGFITGNGARKKRVWMINKKGKDHIRMHFKPLPDTILLQAPSDGIQRLVIFDISERDRKKRLWLRKELLAFGYDPLQKSVYLGDCPLPEDFLREIYDRGLRKCVHIMSLNKLGTVEKKRK
ncbi:MAG: hypothetical protein AAB968_03960 [Patescibacteria group bacterium]